MSEVVIEVLAFAGCPNAEQARLNALEAIRLEGLAAQIHDVEVDTPELALSHRFLGSPSVRVGGEDVEDAAGTHQDYGLMCRTYNDGNRIVGAPHVAMIRAAIRRHVL